MQSDDVVWGIINHQFCSYKIKAVQGGGESHNKTVSSSFCKNEYNLTGLCNKASCPLANSRYATVREIDGMIYLFQKTVERSHSPANLWEKTKLSTNYAKALEQIDSSLIYWPDYMIHRCKQRLTKITQYLIKIRRLRNQETPQLIPINKKTERREKARESKALSAARLTKTLEKELISRLKSKSYGDLPLNVNESIWKSVLENEKTEAELELELKDEMTDEDGSGEEDEEEMEEEFEREFVSDFEESDEDEEDLEDWNGFDSKDGSSDDENSVDDRGLDLNISNQPTINKRKAKEEGTSSKKTDLKKKKRSKIEIEYEEETVSGLKN